MGYMGILLKYTRSHILSTLGGLYTVALRLQTYGYRLKGLGLRLQGMASRAEAVGIRECRKQ